MVGIEQRLKEVRKEQNLTQAEFANLFGLSQSHFSNIENGRENPSETLILFICDKFNINKSWLVEGAGERWPNVDVTTDDGNRSRYAFFRQGVDYLLRQATESDLQYMVDAFDGLHGCISHSQHLLDEDKTAYLKCISELFETLDTLTGNAVVIQSLPTRKPDYKAYLRFRNEMDTGIQSITEHLKEAMDLFLKGHDFDLK